MTVKEIMNSILPAVNSTQADAAARLGWTRQQMSQKIVRNTLRVDELFKIAESSGIEILFRIKETGEEIPIRRKGHGHKMKAMSDRVIYDTAQSNALSNSFYADGKNEYNELGEAQELYVDQAGRYFLVEYNVDPEKEKLKTIPASVAAAFIEKFGTEIEKA